MSGSEQPITLNTQWTPRVVKEYRWPCSLRLSDLARREHGHGMVATGPGPARHEGLGRAWAATQARGTARAWLVPMAGPVNEWLL